MGPLMMFLLKVFRPGPDMTAQSGTIIGSLPRGLTVGAPGDTKEKLQLNGPNGESWQHNDLPIYLLSNKLEFCRIK